MALVTQGLIPNKNQGYTKLYHAVPIKYFILDPYISYWG